MSAPFLLNQWKGMTHSRSNYKIVRVIQEAITLARNYPPGNGTPMKLNLQQTKMMPKWITL